MFVYIINHFCNVCVFIVATPQTNLFGSTPSTFGTQTTGFGQTGFGQPNQVIIKHCFEMFSFVVLSH